MRKTATLVVALVLAGLAGAIPLCGQKQMAKSPRILSAKTVYFEDLTGADAVANATLAQLKKWGRFQIVREKEKADLVMVLSADPYKGGQLLQASGQTAQVDSTGHIEEDKVPTYLKLAPVRYAYLTVIDPKTGDNLWSDSHVWGGLLTGKNSAGERLMKELEKQVGKK